MEKIMFKTPFNFEGRNGFFTCIGVELFPGDGHIGIFPVTSKGYTGRCMIDIDRESIDDLIEALK